MFRKLLALIFPAGAPGARRGARAEAGAPAWMDAKLSPDLRADLLVQRMTLEEQFGLLHGHSPVLMKPRPPGVQRSAGWVPAQPRLGIPALTETDASLGVASAGRRDDEATPLPSGLALAATWSRDVAHAAGVMIGRQARRKGFNVLLAGGVNLTRDPRNGRNFEYLGEDPLLAGMLAGASVRGVQSNHVVSTVKHFVLNAQESGRMVLSAEIDEAALRESDLLAFQIAIEQGQPGAVMSAYNRIGGTYASENGALQDKMLKGDWGYPGWVMSDWGAVHSAKAALGGLDQQSGQEFDKEVFFDEPLKAAVRAGEVPEARIRDMARRILRSMFACGLFDHPVTPAPLDLGADGEVAGQVAEQGIVLLKNSRKLLPLKPRLERIAVIGGRADIGVLSGGGSSQVVPQGSTRFDPPAGAPPWTLGVIYHPSSPLAAIRARAPDAQVTFHDGADPAAAAEAARHADAAIVFATQWSSEAMDVSLRLPDGQDALIAAVAAVNPRTVVVLETGNPVLMPWLSKTPAVLQAWYPGAKGGEAIARVLFGEVAPSGRLPITFPASAAQLPHPELTGAEAIGDVLNGPPGQEPFDVIYGEGSDVGYRWYARTGAKPLFPFGFGLTYTRFRYSDLRVDGGRTLGISFAVTNTGDREGVDTPQVYLTASPDRRQQRLVGWSRIALQPGEIRRVTLKVDPRLLASWDAEHHGWRIDAGDHEVFVGPDAATPVLTGVARLDAGRLKA